MANLTFINHASYLVESEKSLLIVDPWVEGGAFDNGWSLLDKSINNQTLVKYLAEIDKPKYIWLSHEHSDHFSVPFINALKDSQPEVKFIFQKTLDGRVAQFIRKMGFTVSECNDKPQILDSELSIVTFPYLGGDSYSLTMINNFSLLNIFPYFVLGFIGMIIFRNIGDQIFLTEGSQIIWQNSVSTIKDSAKIFLSMAMAAVGLSTNLKDLKSMGYKPFVVGFIAMVTVGLVSIITMKIFTEVFINF